MTPEQRAFARHLRPRLAELLGAIGLDVAYHRAEGDRLWFRDAAGQEVCVLDMLGGFGAGLFGHNHPALVATAKSVLDAQRPMLAQASVRPLAALLAERLSKLVGGVTGRDYVVTLASSGTEAVEAAAKHAELAAMDAIDRLIIEQRRTLRQIRVGLRAGTIQATAAEEVVLGVDGFDDLCELQLRSVLEAPPVLVAVERSFHGKTTGAVKLTHNEVYRTPLRRLGIEVRFVPPGDVGALEALAAGARRRVQWIEVVDGRVTMTERVMSGIVAAFAEPIQGEGGIHELDPAFLSALRRVADAEGFPLVLDEIQSGMGRTGELLASQRSGVRGDYYLLSKALGGGLAKISALLVDRTRYVHEFGYVHTSTFADDDYSSAVALSALDLLEREQVLARCTRAGDHLLGRLEALRARRHRALAAVRGRGLLVGVELAAHPKARSPLLRVLSDQALLGFVVSGYLLAKHRVRVAPTLSASATLRIEPSAFVARADLDRLVDALDDALALLEAEDVARLCAFMLGEGGAGAGSSTSTSTSTVPVPESGAGSGAGSATGSGSGAGSVPHVAFLAHFLEPADLSAWEPRLRDFSDAAAERFLERARVVMDPFEVGRGRVRSVMGPAVDVTVFGVPFLPGPVMRAMREDAAGWALSLVEKAVDLARATGATVLGFGGYTSIVTDGCLRIVQDRMALTSGNSLTAAAALDALLEGGRALGIRERRLGIVGAAGNIGAVLADVAADDVHSIVLVGRAAARRRLEAVAERLAPRVRVEVAADLGALRDCTLVVSATNAARPVILPEHIGDHPTVICDVAVPRDVAPEVSAARPKALVLAGGEVRLPPGEAVEIPGLALSGGRVYGCFAETLLLGLGGIREHFSYGPLEPDRVRRARALARAHGFTIALRRAD